MTQKLETLSRDTVVLVVVDVQERINQVMADQRHTPRIRVLLEAWRSLGLPVVATEQYPRGLGSTLPELAGLLASPALEKTSFSCARDTAFMSTLQGHRPRQVVLTGIEAHVCVTQTALDLAEAGYQVHVPHDAVNSRRPADRSWSLHRLARSGVVVTSTESALFEILDRCGTDDFRTVSRLIKDLPVEDAPQ